MPSSQTDITPLVETGSRKFFAASLNSNGSFGAKEYHEGLMEVDIEFTSEATDISADDEPAYVRLQSPLQGEGTIKFAQLPFNVYSKFFDVRADANGAIVVNSRAKSKEVAFGYYSSVGDGSESMFTMYRAVFQLPSLNAESFNGTTVRDITLNVKVYPYALKPGAPINERVTYSIVNSQLNASIWEQVQDQIYIPDQTIGAGGA
jgi:phi13 family phage major tail protein